MAPLPAAPGGNSVRRPEGFLQPRGDGTFTRVADGQAEAFPVPRRQAGELRQLLGLRDTATALLEAEAASPDDTPELERLRRELGRRYNAYARAYGPVNRFSWRHTGRTDPGTGEEKLARIRPAQGGFRTDPFAPVVQALEEFDPVSQRAAKAAIFTRRVVAPRNPRLGADTPADALAICLDLCGEVRLAGIARLLGVDEDQARRDLGTLVFELPGSGQLVPAAEYLSGNVRDKLKAAQEAAIDDPRFGVNAEELGKVLPADLTPAEISARLGAAWIDASFVRQFLREILDDRGLRVEHPGGQVWAVKGNRHTVLATSTWGTSRYPAPQLAQAVLEQRRIEVRDKVGDDAWVLNMDETLAAQEKVAELAERFSDWAWQDPARAAELATAYNEKLNSLVLRNYDDTELSLPGLALNFEPRPHQVAAVARIIHEPAVGLFHEVGAGKTAEMTMGAMELRRLGLARKPAIVVPNHMLEQFGREFLQLYPQARVMIAQREDLQASRRRLFVARCATGDWDAVILSRSALERIPMSAAAQQAYLNRELDRMRQQIQRSREGDGLTVKRLEAALLRAEERLKAKLDAARDLGITFEATGIDYLFIDEAHGYKNLQTPSNIPDAAIDGSMRASDLDMKLSYLRERNGQRVVTFATATPIANSVTEAFVMQHYLRPDLLEAAGIEDFDAWAATFGQTVTQIEMAPEGGSSFRQKTRFSKFTNVPEMLRIWHVSADIKTGEDLRLPTPALARREADGQRAPETVVVQPCDALLAYVAELGERAGKIRNRAVSPEEDNMLKVSGDGRRAALDLRLIGQPMTTPGKIAAAASRIAAIWAAHRDDAYQDGGGRGVLVRGSLQLVFCDLGTPGDGWNVYGELRAQLTARGLPRAAIRFLHEARTDRDKGELFAACRAGRVAVLIGSTEKMGVGTNVQARAVALHHLDCPWRPADVAQREGRILRQGNLNDEVQLLRYVTEHSFDGYMWLLNRASGEPPRILAWRCQDRRDPPVRVVAADLVRVGSGAMAAGPDDASGSGSWPAGRDVGSLSVPLAGSIAGFGAGVPYQLAFPADARATAAANAYLADLSDTFARPLTLRSYGYDILRWFRFLAAAGVVFDDAVRSDYSDFMRWLQAAGKTGGARRARAGPAGRRLNRETGKVAPDDREFGPATLAHSRIVLHEFYEFLLDRGQRPLVNPVPHAQRRDRGQLRQYPHHNPLTDFGRTGRRHKRYDPPDPKGVPRHLPDGHYDRVWAELTCDRDRALVKIATDCGARPSELLGMSGEDIDWGDALVRVVRKGGAHVQWLPVSRDGIVWLRRYQASSGYVAGPGDPVWVAGRGKRRRMSYEAYRAVFTRINRRLGTNWTPHDLRHTACVRMLDAGMALHQVQHVMGHRQLATTQQYLRPRMDELIEAHREAQARPRPRPCGPGPYAQQDLEDLLGPGQR